MTVFRAPSDYPHWPEVAALIHQSFAYMTPLLGHPAQAMHVTPETLATANDQGCAFLVEDRTTPVACLFTRPSRDYADALYLGWLAVAASHRRQGLAQALVTAAKAEARSRHFTALTLDTGRDLTRLIALFQTMGFRQQPGGGQVVTFRKRLGDQPPK